MVMKFKDKNLCVRLDRVSMEFSLREAGDDGIQSRDI